MVELSFEIDKVTIVPDTQQLIAEYRIVLPTSEFQGVIGGNTTALAFSSELTDLSENLVEKIRETLQKELGLLSNTTPTQPDEEDPL